MNGWQSLDEELARWRHAGRCARLWWRDDDAVRDGPRLRRLMRLAADGLPLALAVVPSRAGQELAALVDAHPSATVLQHGIAHRDNALPGQRRIELGGSLRHARALRALAAARARLASRFGGRFVPVLVPPWNRIDEALLPALPDTGLRGLSTLGPRVGAEPVRGLRVVNVHVDIIDWKHGRCFAGECLVLSTLAGALAARRLAEADPGEPVGIMTHHAVHDEGCWEFLARLIEHTAMHPACDWVSARELFAPGDPGAGGAPTCARSA